MREDRSDHLHPYAFGEDNRPEPVTGPDWDEIDERCFGTAKPDDTVAFGDMSSAFSLLLEWICGGSKPLHVASRAYALLLWLSPDTSKFGSLNAIAQACNCTKQSVSQALLALKDNTGCQMSLNKGHFTRTKFRDAQLAAVERGTHSSQVRKPKLG